jgi:hypothetical protein
VSIWDRSPEEQDRILLAADQLHLLQAAIEDGTARRWKIAVRADNPPSPAALFWLESVIAIAFDDARGLFARGSGIHGKILAEFEPSLPAPDAKWRFPK